MEPTKPRQESCTVRPPSPEELLLLKTREPGGNAGIADSHYAAHLAGRIVYGIAWRDAAPCGEVVLDLAVDLNRPELKHLYVYPEARRNGVGRSLIDWAEAAAAIRGYDQVFLRVGDTNTGARKLYRRLGYASTGVFQTTKYEYPGHDGVLVAAEECDEVFSKQLPT